jgi:hypothetical protein
VTAAVQILEPGRTAADLQSQNFQIAVAAYQRQINLVPIVARQLDAA